jgi:hypothetical protein
MGGRNLPAATAGIIRSDGGMVVRRTAAGLAPEHG